MRTSTSSTCLALLTLVAFSCRTVPAHPPWEQRIEHGIVRAGDAQQAQEAADLIAQALPRILELPGTHRRALVLHVVDQLPNELMDGATFHIANLPDDAVQEDFGYPLEWIEISATALPRRKLSLVAHELTHYYLGEVWDALPQVVEEGLAQLVSMEVDPRYGAEIRVENAVALSTAISGGMTVEMPRAVDASMTGAEAAAPLVPWWVSGDVDATQLPSATEALELDAGGMWTIEDAGSQRVLYGLGYLLASRIGIERLHELCVKAREEGHGRVPADWLYAEAGLDPEEPRRWKTAIADMLGDDEYDVFARRFDRRH